MKKQVSAPRQFYALYWRAINCLEFATLDELLHWLNTDPDAPKADYTYYHYDGSRYIKLMEVSA